MVTTRPVRNHGMDPSVRGPWLDRGYRVISTEKASRRIMLYRNAVDRQIVEAWVMVRVMAIIPAIREVIITSKTVVARLWNRGGEKTEPIVVDVCMVNLAVFKHHTTNIVVGIPPIPTTPIVLREVLIILRVGVERRAARRRAGGRVRGNIELILLTM